MNNQGGFLHLLFIVTLIAKGVSSLSYETVELSVKPCPGRDSCNSTLLPRGSNRGPIEKIDWKKRNCFCDLDCSKYGDCCADSETLEDKDSAREFSCVNLKQYGNVYVKSSCPSSSSTDLTSDVVKACEGHKESDPIGNTPVTSLSTGFTYKNYFCALCHRDSSSIRFWKSRLECPTITGYSDRFRNISKDFVEERLERRGDQWGLEIDTGGIGVFHRCQVDPAVPDELSPYIRSCPGQNLVSSCPPEYTNKSIAKICTSYTGVVNVGAIKYKNPYCAVCHNVTSQQMTCYNLGPLGRFHWPKNFNTYSFAVLFDISGSGSVGKKCEVSTQVYDPYFRKCRNVICRNSNSEYVNGKCVERKVVSTTTAMKPKPELPTTSSKSDLLTTPSIETLAPMAASTQGNKPLVASTTPIPTTQKPEEEESTPITESTTVIYETTEYITYEETTEEPPLVVEEDGWLDTKIDNNNINTNDTDFQDEVEVFSDCPKIILSSDEFTVLENQSIFIPKYERVFDGETFNSDNDSIVICLPSLSEEGGKEKKNSDYYSEESETKFGSYMSYISLICLGISIICLTLHVIASLISPELQNLNGKNLLSLSLCLLGGYSSFIAGMLLTDDGDGMGCKILGLVMYCFFLASFAWMFIISLDICRSLMRATRELRVIGGAQWKKYAIYSLFGWTLPCGCGVLAAYADFSNNSLLLRPGFGEAGLCWFSSKQALLFYFALPFGIIALGNVVFFIISAILVFKTTKEATVRRLNYHLYLKLAMLMGLTWIVGLVAGLLDFEFLWIAFILFNTLQGLFIFLAFTCTKKVINSLRNSFPSTTDSLMIPSTSQSGSRTHSNKLYPPIPRGNREYSGGRSTMYMVPEPNHGPSSNSFNKRYY